MTRLVLLTSVLALVVAPAALAKGPDRATVTGPGLSKPLVVTGAEAPGTPLMTLAESTGLFPAVFGQSPDPMLSRRPKGDLGPRYSVVYRVPGPNRTASTIRQDLYPYAKPFPASYMKPGQPFWQGQHTRGGWFLGDARMKSTLVRAGLPPTPNDSSGGSRPWWILGLVGGLLLVLTAAVLARRRPHGRTAPAT